MIADYRISRSQSMKHEIDVHHNNLTTDSPAHKPKVTLNTFINVIDSIQTKLSCCGIDSFEDWTKQWAHFIAPSCCQNPELKNNIQWSNLFNLKP